MSPLDIAQFLGNLGEFFGAIAVVATLFYVARELRQNTASVQAGAYQTWVGANLDLNLATTDPHMTGTIHNGLLDPKSLDPDSHLRFSFWVLSVFQAVQATDYMYRMDAVDRVLWECEMRRAASMLDAPGVKQWWEAGGRSLLAPTFVEAVEAFESRSSMVAWDPEQGFVPFTEHHGRAPSLAADEREGETGEPDARS